MTIPHKRRAKAHSTKESLDLHKHAYIWQNGKRNIDPTLDDMESALQDSQSLTWIDIQGNYPLYTSSLHHTFNLPHIFVETLNTEKERSKILNNHESFYLILHGIEFDTSNQQSNTPELNIIFGSNYLITLHQVQYPWLDEIRTSAAHQNDDEHLMGQGMARLLYAIFDSLVDSYFPVIEDIDEQIDALENLTLNAADENVQARIFRTKRALAQIRRVISPQVEVANSLIMRTGNLIPTTLEPYFADIHDHMIRSFEIIDSYRDLMSGLLEVHLSTVSNRLNGVMKQLAIIATIFMPITFLTGVFGQNFTYAPQVVHDNGYAFWFILAGMVLISIAQLWWFKKRGWL
jgi:magnesium transporter